MPETRMGNCDAQELILERTFPMSTSLHIQTLITQMRVSGRRLHRTSLRLCPVNAP